MTPLTTLTITTRTPQKWLIVDRESGEQWEWREGSWRRPLEGFHCASCDMHACEDRS